MSLLLAVVVLLAGCDARSSDLWMPSFFQSGMVLQREPQFAVVHGKAPADAVVEVSLLRHDKAQLWTFHTQTTSAGLWEMQFPVTQEKGGPATIMVTTGANASLTFEDVLFGDVILCSGQSNMEVDVTQVFNYTEIEQPDSIHYPNMRLFQIDHNAQSAPVDDAPIKGQFKWVAPSPLSLGNFTQGSWKSFSAVCYFTGRELARRDPSVPLGLLTTCFGGTSVRRWSSPEALQKCNVTGAGYSDLWYGMVVPFLKLRFSGMLWYQAEADAGHPDEYKCTFPAMIEDWRSRFDLPNVPFGFVELAAYPNGDFSSIRLAQAEALKVPNVFMATAIDLGDPHSPLGAIHPRSKQEVGRRLSLGLESQMYGVKQVTEGPRFQSAQVWKFNDVNWTLRLAFSNGDGLHLNGTSFCSTCCTLSSPVEVLIQGNWRPVETLQLKVSDSAAFFTGVGIAAPTAVRGMWGAYPQCALYNSERLASPTFFSSTIISELSIQ